MESIHDQRGGKNEAGHPLSRSLGKEGGYWRLSFQKQGPVKKYFISVINGWVPYENFHRFIGNGRNTVLHAVGTNAVKKPSIFGFDFSPNIYRRPGGSVFYV